MTPAKYTLDDMIFCLGDLIERCRGYGGRIGSVFEVAITERDLPVIEATWRFLQVAKMHEGALRSAIARQGGAR